MPEVSLHCAPFNWIEPAGGGAKRRSGMWFLGVRITKFHWSHNEREYYGIFFLPKVHEAVPYDVKTSRELRARPAS